MSSRLQALFRGSVAVVALTGGLAVGASASAASWLSFATYAPLTNKSDLTWHNNIVPKTVTVIPAVTRFVPAVTKIIPAVTKVVKGKVVVVTPAKTVIVTPAKTVVITPSKTIITPAHDGTSGSLFSTTSTNSNVFGLANVSFHFLNKKLRTLGNLPATFSFMGTSPAVAPAISIGDLLMEPNLSGSFAFAYTGLKPLHVWTSTYKKGANLLSGSIVNFALAGYKGGTGWVAGDTSAGSTIIYNSDFLDFSHINYADFSLALNSLTPSIHADAGAALHTFKANSVGVFGSSPAPRPTAVPEPASWIMMIVGLIGTALVLRRRREADATT